MRTRLFWFLLATALPSLGEAAPRKKAILFFTKSSGYEHAVIKVSAEGTSHASRVLAALGDEHGFAVTHSKDGGIFTPEGIASYDAFVFFTTGDLTSEGKDKNPPMPSGGKDLLLNAIARGKGFVGVHAATDTFHSPGDRSDQSGDRTDPFVKMLGGEFNGHGDQQKADVVCINPKFPGFKEAGSGFALTDEWYGLRNLAPDLHVVLSLETWSLDNSGKNRLYRRPPYPVAWARRSGKGRVFYHAMGHREDVWDNPLFQQMLVGSIKWATGLVNASTPPNVGKVTPGYQRLPPRESTQK